MPVTAARSWTERPLIGRTACGRRNGLVLQGGYATCILVESVEKPTDNRSASLLCCRVADADSPETISLALAPAHFPTHPLHAPGPAATSTEIPDPVLRAGPDVETRPQSPSGGIREGDQGRVRISSP